MTITESNNKTNMKEPIFKPGDRIYHPFLGWAMVYNYESPVRDSYYPHGYYQLVLEIGDIWRTEDRDYVEKMYSFTEYDAINGGFSQERPHPSVFLVIELPEESIYACFSTRERAEKFVGETPNWRIKELEVS